MGKALLVFIIAFSLMGTYYALQTKRGHIETQDRLATHQFEALARNSALAGYQRARQDLAEDFDHAGPSITGTYEGVPYQVAITYGGNVATISAVGTATTERGKEVPYRIKAQVLKELIQTIEEEAPPFMHYALLSDQNLQLNGNVLGDLYVAGTESNTLNANMHTNGNLHIDGNSVHVRGFGTYVGSASANPSAALTGSFDPNYNPTDDPVVERTTPVDIPTFDTATFVSNVPVDQTSTSDVTLSGTYNLGGTRDDPYVWYVQGSVTATGNTTFSGYVMFIIDGNVTFNGNVRAGDSGYDGGDESNIAFYASGSVALGGTTDVYGQIYAAGTVSFLHGSPNVYGNITTLGVADLRGTPKIYYRPASPALTTVFKAPEIRLSLASYSEW